MEHEKMMEHATTLAAAFIANGDLRHRRNFRDDGSSETHEQVTLLLIQMYRAVEEASFEARQTSWAKRMKGEIPDPTGNA
ncbi:hypothetical protein [Azonexus sp.]|uniref:hypothetical protein n=1 Tax=Azonexus sp. TaxID=1872668 RepID=UPI0027B8CD6A|nr:hypothetical protein [Azonexus sp.]